MAALLEQIHDYNSEEESSDGNDYVEVGQQDYAPDDVVRSVQVSYLAVMWIVNSCLEHTSKTLSLPQEALSALAKVQDSSNDSAEVLLRIRADVQVIVLNRLNTKRGAMVT